MSDRGDSRAEQDDAEIAAARAARRDREAEQTPAQRLLRLDALIREMEALKGAVPKR